MFYRSDVFTNTANEFGVMDSFRSSWVTRLLRHLPGALYIQGKKGSYGTSARAGLFGEWIRTVLMAALT
jgi:hypothetical protein